MRPPLPLTLAPVLAALALASCSRPKTTPPAAPPTTAVTETARVATASFTFPTQTLTVPAGFTVELVAGPPLVNRPISIAFDHRGRLYATDSSGLSDKADKQFEQKPHRIVRLDDADSDGRFESSVVFAENMMFPQGALFYEGSLYVAAPPHIWKLTDSNDDGIADKREVWYDGKTLTGCANDLHGPYLGPEGWFYWTKGAFAEQRHTLPNGRPFVTRAAHIFRARPDGSALEPVLTGGMDNPVNVTFTATGERILSGTFFQIGVAGKRDGLIHAIYGGVYGKDQPAIAGHTRTGDLMPVMTHMGAAAPCGSLTYRSSAFGADYTGNLFVCYFNLRKVSRHELRPDGATFTTRDTDFVTSDSHDFHPTDVLEDADGSILVVDTGGWYKVCCPTSQLAKPDVLGGIYRIRKTGATKAGDPRGLHLHWSAVSAAELARRLSDHRPEVVDRALHLLGQRGEGAVPALLETATKAPAAAARRNAVWALARIDTAPARAAIRAALADPDTSVVHVALQAVSLGRDVLALDALGSIVAGQQPALARLAAEALGRIGDARALAPIFKAIEKLPQARFTRTGTPEDSSERILEHALIYALIEIGRPDDVLAYVKPDNHRRVIRAALVALGQMDGGIAPEQVTPWLESAVPLLRSTAAWVVARHPEWGDALASFFRARLAHGPAAEADASEFESQLALLAKSKGVQDLLASLASDTHAPLTNRLTALRAMAAAAPGETPVTWHGALAIALAGEDLALVRQAVVTAGALPLPKSGHAGLALSLGRVGRKSTLPADLRVEALAALPAAALGRVEADVFGFLRTQLDLRQSMLTRSAAATVLARAQLTAEQRLALAEAMTTVGALEAPKLLAAFEKGATEAQGLKLVAALQQSPAKAGLRGYALQNLFAKYPASVQREAETLFAQLKSDVAQQNAHVDTLLAAAKNGDVRRGQAVFNSEKTACALCHKIGYLGGLLGPDLTTIGRIRNERELLEAVVFPSATLARGYETFTLTTRTGETHTGILKKDTAEEVILATGPQAEVRVARGDIAEMQPAAHSPMPPGMDAVLTKQELADLLAFLKSRQ